MATVIRLTRMGRKKKPFYRIVVTDSRKRRDGGWIEAIGFYNPLNEPKEVKIDRERLEYWKSVGAKMSERVAKISAL
ncbi:MAG: 30S ribosomal protein S16 [Helicobacter sp.]|nr:30S ribosomal protein S16 [Helicobacter sp.]